MHVEGLPAFDLCLLEQHGTDGAMQMHSVSVSLSLSIFPVFLSLSLVPLGFRCTVTQREVACPVALDFLAPMETLCLSLNRGGQEEREMETDGRREKKGVRAGRRSEFGTHMLLSAQLVCIVTPSFCSVPLSAVVLTLAARKLVNLCHITHK